MKRTKATLEFVVEGKTIEFARAVVGSLMMLISLAIDKHKLPVVRWELVEIKDE